MVGGRTSLQCRLSDANIRRLGSHEKNEGGNYQKTRHANMFLYWGHKLERVRYGRQ